MALFHSPKTSTDGLVFMYDTGNSKSYKGEPTTNLITNSGTSNTGWAGHGWTGSQAISNDYPNTYEFTATNGWHNRTFDTGVTSGGTIYVSFQYKLKQQQTTQNQIFVLNGTHLGSYTNYIGNGSMSFEWQTFSGSFTANTNSSKIAIGPRGQDSSGLTDIVYIRNLQVEQKPHATQFVNGTRSATQGLIDRTGNSTIDLSPASYDSNAQITFDGTDDYITLGSDSVLQDIGSHATIECWFKSSATGSKFALMVGWGDGTSYYSNFGIGNWYSAQSDESIYVGVNSAAVIYAENDGSTKYHDGNWHHAVALMGHNNHKIYVDGSEVSVSFPYGSNSVSTSKLFGFSSGTEVYIGLRPYGNGHFQGELPVVKIYNRLLSDDEILQNYNATKSRFGL
jgi:hypothetical protein